MIENAKTIAQGSGSENADAMFTAKDLEAILKIDVKTIYSYVQRGLIPYVRIESNLRFPKREIYDWIERRSYRPTTHMATAQRKLSAALGGTPHLRDKKPGATT